MSTPRELLTAARENLRKLSRMFHPGDRPALPPGAKERTLVDVQNDYNRLCVELGHRHLEQEKARLEHEEALDRISTRAEELRAEANELGKRAEQKKPDLKAV